MTEPHIDDDKNSWEGKPFYKNPFVIAFVLGALALTLMRPLSLLFLDAPDPLVHVQPWSMTGDDDKPFGTEQLKGKVWLANFIFTRCPTQCPKLTQVMQKAVTNLDHHGDNMHFVSFTVDPTYDKPPVFQAYKEKFNISSSRWTFVTGSEKDMHDLLQGQLKLFVGEKKPVNAEEGTPLPDAEQAKPPRDQLFDIAHSGRLALFDQNGDLRGLFTADDAGLAAMGNAAKLLVLKGPNP